jgi:hypothetical protein
LTVLEDILADLDYLYDVEFGFAEVIAATGGDFVGIFDNEYLLADSGSTIAARSAVPVMRTRDADARAEGAVVTIRGTGYTVSEPMPDGYGETTHKLRTAPGS